MKKLFVFIAVVFVLAFGYAASAQSDKGISSKKFERLMKKQNAVIIDVRTEAEFSEGYIPGATLIDVNKEEDFLKQISGLDKNARYLLYCRSGKRSEKALNLMKQNGFIKVEHLKGGYSGWTGPKKKE